MGGLKESVEITLLAPDRRDAEVTRLIDPWIGDEGPLDVAFRRGVGGTLRQRGVAFDDKTTVVWDEDAVQVLRITGPEHGVVPLRSEVLLRKGLRESGPARLFRVDYLCGGALLGSRWLTEGDHDA